METIEEEKKHEYDIEELSYLVPLNLVVFR